MPNDRTGRFKQRARVPIVLLSLGLILYFSIYLAAFVPSGDFEYYWLPDNVMVVQSVYEGSPVAPQIQPDDVILEIDGKPARWSLWRPLFTPGQQVHEYTIQRGEQTFNFSSATAPPNALAVRRRAASGLVALISWLVGTLAILYATPDNRDAWQLGLTTTLVAVVIAASEAALYNVPGGWLASNPFFPLIAVAWVQVALLPRDELVSLYERTAFKILYIVAALIGLAAFLELLLLVPNGSSLHLATGISSYDILLLCLAVGLLAHLVVLGWRYFHLPASYQKQQTLIILVFAALAYLPLLLLTVLPGFLFDVLLLPWELSILLLALSPAGYAYVIYRRNYLGLDIFITRTLTLLIISLLLLSAFSLLFYFVASDLSGVLPGTLLIFSLLLGGPYTNRKIRHLVDLVIYGRNAGYQESIAHFTATLSTDPQLETLKGILREVGAMLQVRQMVLMLVDPGDKLVVAERQRVDEDIEPIQVQAIEHLLNNSSVGASVRFKNSDHPIFRQHQWIDYVLPLSTSGRVVGALFLGRPVPDGYLNAEQMGFLHQVTNVMAVALEAIRLFESSREMSRTLLEIRNAERVLLASQIHDEPLQEISMLASSLLQLAKQGNPDSRLAEELGTHSQALQNISKQLREICAGLYPPVLQQGPQWAVKDVVYDFQQKTDLDIRLSITLPDDTLISEDVTRVVYYLLTESLNNVHKHASASTVWISLSCMENRLLLTIEDDGKASSPAALSLSDLIRGRHFGIAGMYEWTGLIQGKLILEPRDDGGTIVTLSAPLDR